MAQFKVNVPIPQKDPIIKVDSSRTDPLPLGANRFRLIVVDDAGNESEPSIITVNVRDQDKPTAILEVVNSDGKVLERNVPFGSSFILSGASSGDVPPGKVVEYRFTLLDRV